MSLSIGGFKITSKPQRGKYVSSDVEVPVEVQEESLQFVAPDWFDQIHISTEPRQILTFGYEDHSADVRLRAKAKNLGELLVALGIGMINYMTPLGGIVSKSSRTFNAQGSDLKNLIFHMLDELLFLYGSEYFMAGWIRIDAKEFNKDSGIVQVTCTCFGEPFDKLRHSQGTEIKAITMHDMIVEIQADCEAVVLLDI